MNRELYIKPPLPEDFVMPAPPPQIPRASWGGFHAQGAAINPLELTDAARRQMAEDNGTEHDTRGGDHPIAAVFHYARTFAGSSYPAFWTGFLDVKIFNAELIHLVGTERYQEAINIVDAYCANCFSSENNFSKAYAQVTEGKGNERHGKDADFWEQPWFLIASEVGIGFLTGQALKKVIEAPGLPTGEATLRELWGAMVYLAMASLMTDDIPGVERPA